MANKYRFVGDHAVDLGNGMFVGPGEFADIDDTSDPIVAELIEKGQLLEAKATKASKTEATNE